MVYVDKALAIHPNYKDALDGKGHALSKVLVDPIHISGNWSNTGKTVSRPPLLHHTRIWQLQLAMMALWLSCYVVYLGTLLGCCCYNH
jgi:hypothetical protein